MSSLIGGLGGNVIGEAVVDVRADTDKLKKDLRSARGVAEKETAGIQKGLDKASKFAGGALLGIGAAAFKAVGGASDLSESMNKTTATFGKAAKIMPGYTGSVADSLGMSRAAALDAAAGIGAMLIPMGKSQKEAATMSARMTTLSADLGSFHNQDPTEMLDRIRAGLSGESEPLKRFGINLSEARVQAEALRMGLVKQGETMTDAQKITARYSLIQRDAGAANGDFAKTADGLANQQRIMQAELADLGAELGKALVPAMNRAIGVARTLLGFFKEHTTLAKVLIGIIAGLAGAVLAANVAFRVYSQVTKIATAATKAQAVAQRVLNAVMKANPIIRIVTILGLLVGAFVLAYKESETFRKIVDGALEAVTDAAEAVADFFTEDLVGAFEDTVEWVRRHWPAIATLLSGPFAPMVALATDAFGIRSALTGALDTLIRVVPAKGEAIAKGIWAGFTGFATDVAGWVRRRVRDEIDAFTTFGSWGEKIAKGLWGGFTGFVTDVGEWVRNRVFTPINDLREGIEGRGSAIARWIAAGAKEGAKALVEGMQTVARRFINAVIRVINALPFVDLDLVTWGLASGGTLSRAGVGQALARGGKATAPTVLVGEEAPRHPEYVIPTNPRYRGRAMGLLGSLLEDLGGDRIAAYARGGRIGDRMGGPLDFVGGLLGDLLGGGANAVLSRLPSPSDYMPPWMAGFGKAIVADIGDWLKDKLTFWGGGGGAGSFVGLGGGGGSLAAATALASRFGLSVTSGFRMGDPGWHGKNRARDYSNSSGPTPQMAAFAQAAAAAFGSRLLELIYSPLGWGVKNGRRVPMSFFGPAVTADHYDHVHLAMARGGIIPSYAAGTPYVPADGLAYLHRGEAVLPADGGAPASLVSVGQMVVRGPEDPAIIATRLSRQLAIQGVRP